MDAWLDRLRKEIEETTADLCDTDWIRAPKGRWNSAQIMEHLGRSYGTTAKMLELAMAVGGPPQVRSSKLPELLKKILIVNLGIFPSGTKSPAIVLPKGDPGSVALNRAFINLERMNAALSTAEQRWGNEAPIATHFVLGPMNSVEWKKFHYVHGHHHLLQVRRRVADKPAL